MGYCSDFAADVTAFVAIVSVSMIFKLCNDIGFNVSADCTDMFFCAQRSAGRFFRYSPLAIGVNNFSCYSADIAIRVAGVCVGMFGKLRNVFGCNVTAD